MKFFVKDFCETVQARIGIFNMQVDDDVLWDCEPAFSCLFFPDFCEIVQARVNIYDMQADNDVWYRGIANQPFHAYSSLYLSDFLSFHTLNNEIFVKDFYGTIQDRIFIFCMQCDTCNGILYRGIANQPFHANSSLYLSDFLSCPTLNNKIFYQRFL